MSRILNIVLFCTYLGVLFTASLIPDFLEAGYQTDKMLHIMTVCITIMWSFLLLERPKHTYVFSGCIFCGSLLVEGLQSFTPDRKAELGDIFANAIGISLGLLIGYLIKSGWNASRTSAA